MSEPESLSTVEGLETHIRRHSLDRLIMISDGIFAIAITLAALEIKLPEEMEGNLGALLHAMLRPTAAYLLAFMVVVIFWLQHRDLFARIRRVDPVLTGLTMLLLCVISLVPVTIPGIYAIETNPAGFQIYLMTMVACGAITLAMWAYAAWRPGIMRAEVAPAFRLARTLMAAVLPAVFLVALLVPVGRLIWVMIPLGIAAGVVRRFVLPRWLKARS
jgi:uncharacterized membrane protein